MTTEQMRELDAVCATMVMGWKFCSKTAFPSSSDGTTYYIKSCGIKRKFEDDYGSQDTFWSPTTSPADAFEVLKRCGGKGLNIDMDYIGPKTGWQLTLTSDTRTQATAETFELAICLFAQQLFKATK